MTMFDAPNLFKSTAMPDRDWWQAIWPDPASVLRDIGIRPNMIVIDLCCGDGYFTAPLSQLVDGKVYALDLDPLMLEKTQHEISRIGAPACQLLEADAFEVAAIVAEKVDYVLIANTFHGVPDKTELARRVASVLRPEGQFAIVNWHSKPREHSAVLGKPRGPSASLRMTPDQTRNVVEPAGFRLERVVELPPYHYASVFAKPQAHQNGSGGDGRT